LSSSALHRHRKHISHALNEARRNAESSCARDLAAELLMLAAKAKGLAEQAERAGDIRTALAGVRELSNRLMNFGVEEETPAPHQRNGAQPADVELPSPAVYH
jgi:hypothetical protein